MGATSMDYWGSAETVPPGQPRAIHPQDSNAELLRIPLDDLDYNHRGSRTTYGVWPNRGEENIAFNPADGNAGAYLFRTNFSSVPFSVGPEFDFLPSPHVRTNCPTLAGPIRVSWQPLPQARAYEMHLFGFLPDKTNVSWSSSQVAQQADRYFHDSDPEAIPREIDRGNLFPPSTASCTVPAGIFQGCRDVYVAFHAYGPRSVQTVGNTVVHVRTDYHFDGMVWANGRRTN
jgi:hypothetical protein